MRTAPGQAPPTAHTEQQQPCRSVALLSRVRTQNGNDQLRAPPTKAAIWRGWRVCGGLLELRTWHRYPGSRGRGVRPRAKSARRWTRSASTRGRLMCQVLITGLDDY